VEIMVSRRRFLKSGSAATAVYLLGRSFRPQLVYSADFVLSMWSGAITPTSARVNARLDHDSSTVRLHVSPNADLSSPITSGFFTADTSNNRMVGISISGLSADSQYHYGIESGGMVDGSNRGMFKTPAVGPQSFTVAFGSCAQTGSAHAVFDTIRSLNPLFFLHTGDMHYEDIGVNNQNTFRAAFDTVLASSTQSALYRAVPIAYMWDDHDYGPNDSDSTAPGRQAARLTYQEYVPHYPLAAGSGNVPIYQAFTIGRARFILTDLRSERTPKTAADNASKTMMGSGQKAWFKNELLNARDQGSFIVWVGTVPWIGATSTGGDHWAGYTTERRELANFIRDNRILNILMLSGDAHMIAIDDGTNNDYATGGGARFPVMHAAALDRSGSTKGGPYSHGSFPGGGQFGLMTITDNGGLDLSISLSGRDANNITLVEHSFGALWREVHLPLVMKG
jgi:alkaline phosphatase D